MGNIGVNNKTIGYHFTSLLSNNSRSKVNIAKIVLKFNASKIFTHLSGMVFLSHLINLDFLNQNYFKQCNLYILNKSNM